MRREMDLRECRQEIDRIDGELVKLLEERMDVVREVAEYKRASGGPVYDPAREEEKLVMIRGAASDDFCKEALPKIFAQIMACSRELQYSLIPGTDRDDA